MPSVSGSISHLSPIRVVPKDDNLGLGARGGAHFGTGKCTGLDVFHGILGRLNGRDGEQIESQDILVEEQKRTAKQESRFCALLFVSGGFLGESGQEELQAKYVKDIIPGDERAQVISRSIKQSPRQLTSKENPATPTESIELLKNQSSRQHRARSKFAVVNNPRPETYDPYTPISIEQDIVKRAMPNTTDLPMSESPTAPQRLTKAERKQRKKMRRETRRTVPTELPMAPVAIPLTDVQETSTHPPRAAPVGYQHVPQLNKPVGGRHAARQRYISHKKLATMDSKALNEVCLRSIHDLQNVILLADRSCLFTADIDGQRIIDFLVFCNAACII